MNTVMTDLELIYDLFDHSILFQEKNGFPVWKNYDRSAIINDIQGKNQYKIMIEEEVGIVFSLTYSDKIIWRERDSGDSVYLHRIVVNPKFRGRKLFGEILTWAIDHAKNRGLTSIRMDTWASNTAMVNYYMTYGFERIENYTTPTSEDLPVHNRNLHLTLLEYTL